MADGISLNNRLEVVNPERALFGVPALLLAARAAVTIIWCAFMPALARAVAADSG